MTSTPFLPQIRSSDNVHYQVFRADGSIKPIFQENALCKSLLKTGLLSPLWINSIFAPFVSPFLGSYGTEKVIGNLITNVGFAQAANLLGNVSTPTAFGYIAVGTGTTAAAVTDTTLQTESAASGLSRAASTNSTVTTTVTNDTCQFTKTFTVTGSVAVTESGVLDAASTGNLLCRQVFSAINVVNGDSLQITWKVQMH